MSFVIFYRNTVKKSELCTGCSYWLKILWFVHWNPKNLKTFSKNLGFFQPCKWPTLEVIDQQLCLYCTDWTTSSHLTIYIRKMHLPNWLQNRREYILYNSPLMHHTCESIILNCNCTLEMYTLLSSTTFLS